MEIIRYGSAGNAVRLLQLALRREGSLRAAPGGEFGTRTLSAARRFQAARGLTPDGVIGMKTWAALEPYLYGVIRHRLRAGDTLYRLGKKYGVSAAAVQAANPALDPASLPVGREITIPLPFPLVPTDMPYSSELISLIVRGLGMRYPFIQTETIGASVLGRPLYSLRMGRGGRRLFINAAHHANEWITTPLVMDFLETYAAAYAANGTLAGRSAKELFASVTLFIAPMVDPDGVDLVCGAMGKEGFARALAIAENYPRIPFPSGWKANIEGVDLNLSYPAGWEEAKRIKFAQGFTRPAPRDFVGKAPLSAPEARAVYEYTLKNGFDMTLSYHTQGGEIYWSYGDIEPESARAIGERLAQVSGYTLTEAPPASSYAGYKDWFIKEYGRPGYTIEAGRGENPLPLSQYGRIREDNFPLIVTAMEACAALK
jgi:g-D-glutamyl-meso-diaminopimelate peptidase